MASYKRLLKYIQKYWQILLIAMVCMAGVGAMTGASAMVVQNILDDIFIDKDERMLKLVPIAVVLIFVIKGVFYYLQEYLMAYISQQAVRNLRDDLYSHIQRQSLTFFSNNSTGNLMSRITYDVNLISAAVSSAFSSLLRDSFSIIALTGVVLYRDWQLALMAMLFYPLAMYPIIRFGKKLRKVGTESQEKMGYINSFLNETISGAKVVKAFGMEDYETERFAEANKNYFKLILKSFKVKALSRPTMEVLSSTGVAAVIWYGGAKVMENTMTTGEFFSFMTAMLMLYKPIKNLSSINNIIQEGLAAAVRVFHILDTKPDIQDAEGAIEIDGLKNNIEFKNINFRYDKDKVINSLNLNVKKGERIAIVGSSGSGKTTLVNLIPRFYDIKEGNILLDDKNQKDVTVQSLRSLIAIVTQETILFDDTIRNNIAYGQEETSEADILLAAKAAFAHDFILKCPRGYDTEIGEQGLKLSGGQRQRLSIARAILKNAPILILDEATSALDPESEKLVQGALNNLMKNRTSFVIAHRLSTIMDADRIVVMKDGSIVEEGAHDELLESGGHYAKLWKRQFASS